MRACACGRGCGSVRVCEGVGVCVWGVRCGWGGVMLACDRGQHIVTVSAFFGR